MNGQGILTLDLKGTVTAASREAVDAIGRHYSVLYTEEDRAAGLPAAALETAARAGRHEAEAWRLRNDGSRFRANIRIEALRDAAGELAGFAEFVRPAAHAEGAAAFSQLSGGIAHDFNNALHVIRNAIDALHRRLPAGDTKGAAVVEMARRNATYAASLTQLLVHASHHPLEPRPIDFNAALGAATELLRQSTGSTIELEILAAPDLWTVWIDARQLGAALVNLTVNAREAMPRGGRLTIRTANVTLDAAYAAANEIAAGDYVMVALTDTGVGMTPATAARAFDPFFTTKDGGLGTGLGLSQAYAFVKRSNGHAEIDSVPGEGTTVKLYLPRSPGKSAPATAAAAQRPVRELAGLRVLVIEDEALLGMSIESMLEQLGCTMIGPVASLADALEQAASADVDLALLDVNLRGEAGYPVASTLEARDVPFVFMSGYGELDGRWRTRPSVQKPFELSQLADEMQRAVARG